MSQYIIRRLLLAIPVLLGVSLLVFMVLHFLPVDPVRMMLTEHRAGTAPTADGAISDEQIEEMRRALGLDRPLHIQFGRFIINLLQGDLGTSWRTKRAVATMIVRNAPYTIQLSLAGLVVSVVLGTLLGTIAAVREHSWFDTSSMTAAVFGVSVPQFWLGLMMMLVFGHTLRWFPAVGVGTWRHLVLPGMTMGLAGAALIARMTRSSLVEVLRQDYIVTARSKGLSERVVIYKHALRNAMIPVITIIGLSLGNMLGGSVIIENVFGRPGMGRIAVDAIWEKDFPVVQATVLLMAVAFVLANLLVDIFYGFMDPRIRYQ